jgi:hypothetical protein
MKDDYDIIKNGIGLVSILWTRSEWFTSLPIFHFWTGEMRS